MIKSSSITVKKVTFMFQIFNWISEYLQIIEKKGYNISFFLLKKKVKSFKLVINYNFLCKLSTKQTLSNYEVKYLCLLPVMGTQTIKTVTVEICKTYK